jgi:hypothetical protein
MDSRTTRLIETLHPNARAWARAHLQAVEASGKLPTGYTIRIISGNRTWAEQNELFAQGRTKPGAKVTNARGGQSNHNFGIAWDIGLFDEKGNYLEESRLYTEIGPIGEEIGLEWGGRWKSFRDTPHYGVKTGLTTSQLRALMIEGKGVPVQLFGGSAPAPAPTDEVKVYDGAKQVPVRAFLDGGRVWVAVRQFVDIFGGEIVAVDGSNFTVELHEENVAMSGTVRDGAGYVKFADLNRVLEWGYSYGAGKLTIIAEVN